MGNMIGRRKQVVDERYTKPQGLYQHKDVDQKKLRKLILKSKLAPCYPGDDECSMDLEECPICFLHYPSLNRSSCCMKGICTECFLQMKPPHLNRPTQCPFCKTSNYAVEYCGMRTKEEKGMEQLEEQRVIEAQIRMRQQELQDDKVRMQQIQDIASPGRLVLQTEIERAGFSTHDLSEELDYFQESCAVPLRRIPSYSRQRSDDHFDHELEDLMVMEAIWLSIQENGGQRNFTGGSGGVPPESTSFLNGYRTSPDPEEHCSIQADPGYISGVHGSPIFVLNPSNAGSGDVGRVEGYLHSWMEAEASEPCGSDNRTGEWLSGCDLGRSRDGVSFAEFSTGNGNAVSGSAPALVSSIPFPQIGYGNNFL